MSDLAVPDPYSGMRLDPAQRTIWDELWRSGPATQWGAAEAHCVSVLAILLSRIYSGQAAKEDLIEARHLRDSLGLTPAARARLNWKTRDDDDEEEDEE